MKKIKILFLLLLAGGGLSHASVQKTLFSADVVASACHVVVDADGTGSSRLTFGTYRKSSAAPVPPRDFTVRLYETGATVQGCSAFLAGQIATLNFGNPGQLDGQGVVTRGAGDGIRIDVRAADTQADFRGRITQANHEVKYPVDFAAKGQFRFRAQPVFPADVKAGVPAVVPEGYLRSALRQDKQAAVCAFP
ncbi:fimbrial protein [Salmonella enterica]|uniref:fimbrial protein n=4 Tax=Salmonella enterica TaxID=28901 RepID=UPI002117F657|nr:fimbrial protein [Salmonella enterica]MDJ4887915.1 fimbrial protein [Salmonella enterica]MDV3411625.1 fimbrial protein [Salmonella enterica]